MCRYGEASYKEPFACFDCRKSFKQMSYFEIPEHQRPTHRHERIVLCPQCGCVMADIGHDFKAPPMRDLRQWEKVRLLFEGGATFHSCGCGGPGYRPKKLSEVEQFMRSFTRPGTHRV